MSDHLMSFFDADRNAVIVRLESGREVAVLDLDEAQSFGNEVLAAARGEETGYAEFLAQENGVDPDTTETDADPNIGGETVAAQVACIITDANTATEDDCTTHDHEIR